MEPRIRPARSDDSPHLEALLAENRLPVAGVDDILDTCVVADDGGRIAGAAGLELYGSAGLLRSVVVSAAARSRGLGRQLVDATVALARERGVTDLYLLTTTAEAYFTKLGFMPVDRAAVPMTVQQSVEFHGACPATAVAMHAVLRSS